VALLWGLAALALALFLTIRANPNSGLLLIAAGVLGGAGLVWALTMGIQYLDGAGVGAWGYEREMVVLALLLLSFAVPWRIEVQAAKAGAIFGWSTPLSWLVALGLAPTLARRLRRFEAAGLALSGAALASWFGWITWLTVSPAFRSLDFPFRPVDLLDYGWYAALAAWAVAADGAAARAAWEHDGRVSTPALLAWALAPGAGLVRLEHRVGGRLWLLGTAIALFFLRGTGYSPTEFAYWASNAGQLPRVTSRGDFTVFAALVVLVWLASVLATFWVRRRDAAGAGSGAQQSG
jgi:hypothetical protein